MFNLMAKLKNELCSSRRSGFGRLQVREPGVCNQGTGCFYEISLFNTNNFFLILFIFILAQVHVVEFEDVFFITFSCVLITIY